MEKSPTGAPPAGARPQDSAKAVPGKRLLRYRPGELIIKEGDFGVSLYRIISGTVSILKESGGENFLLFELGAGDIFGEMVFIDGGLAPRTASVQAKDAVEVEAWHYLSVLNEYKAANPVVRFIATDMVKKLEKMSAVYDRLRARPQAQQTKPPAPEVKASAFVAVAPEPSSPAPEAMAPATAVSGHETILPESTITEIEIKVGAPTMQFKLAGDKDVGKEWEGKVEYRLPLNSDAGLLNATGVDINEEGIRIDIPFSNMSKGGHEPGSEIDLIIYLPGGVPVTASGEITSISRGSMVGHTAMRIRYKDLFFEARDRISTFIKE